MSDLHVERSDLVKSIDGIEVCTMWCGEQCIAFPDGSTVPAMFDFYSESAAYKATCQPCRSRFADGIHLDAETPTKVSA